MQETVLLYFYHRVTEAEADPATKKGTSKVLQCLTTSCLPPPQEGNNVCYQNHQKQTKPDTI